MFLALRLHCREVLDPGLLPGAEQKAVEPALRKLARRALSALSAEAQDQVLAGILPGKLEGVAVRKAFADSTYDFGEPPTAEAMPAARGTTSNQHLRSRACDIWIRETGPPCENLLWRPEAVAPESMHREVSLAFCI